MLYMVPLNPRPEVFWLQMGGKMYRMRTIWDAADEGGWTLDIGDDLEQPLVGGIPFVTGCDLLDQYAYLGFNARLYVYTNGAPFTVPNRNNLGGNANLFVEDT